MIRWRAPLQEKRRQTFYNRRFRNTLRRRPVEIPGDGVRRELPLDLSGIEANPCGADAKRSFVGSRQKLMAIFDGSFDRNDGAPVILPNDAMR